MLPTDGQTYIQSERRMDPGKTGDQWKVYLNLIRIRWLYNFVLLSACLSIRLAGCLRVCVHACMFPPAYIPLLSTPTRLVNSTSVPSPIFHTTLHCEYGIHGGLSRHGILQCSYCVQFTSLTPEVGKGSNSAIIKKINFTWKWFMDSSTLFHTKLILAICAYKCAYVLKSTLIRICTINSY